MPKSRQLPPPTNSFKNTAQRSSQKHKKTSRGLSAFAAVRLSQRSSKTKQDNNIVGQKRKQLSEHGDIQGKKLKFFDDVDIEKGNNSSLEEDKKFKSIDDDDIGKGDNSHVEGASKPHQQHIPNDNEGRRKNKGKQRGKKLLDSKCGGVMSVAPIKEVLFIDNNTDGKLQKKKSSKRYKQTKEVEDTGNVNQSDTEILSQAEEKFLELWEAPDDDCPSSDEEKEIRDLDNDGENEAVTPRYGDDSALVLNTEDGAQLLLLRDNQEIGVSGKCRLLPVCGVPSVFGYKITRNKFHDIFSPNSSSFLTIKSEVPEKNEIKVQRLFLKFEDIVSNKDFEKLLHFPTRNVTVVKLENLSNGYLEYITTLSPFQHLFEQYECSTALDQGETIYRTFALGPNDGKTVATLDIDNTSYRNARDIWLQAVSQKSNEKAPSVVVIGPANSGKSTLVRYLINSTLNQHDELFHLECDVGQTEFTPSSCIALHHVTEAVLGPPFCNQSFPTHTYFYGGLSSFENPTHYLKCIRKCHREYCIKGQQVPLVVNTPGWIKGLGKDILVDIIRTVKPDFVIQLTANYFRIPLFTTDMVHFHLSWEDKQMHKDMRSNHADYKLIEVEATGRDKDMKYRASDHRNLKVLSYMGMNFNTNSGMTLSSMVPYKLNWEDIGIHVCLENVSPAKILAIINASIVALCSVNLNKGYRKEKEQFWMFSQTPVCKCHGFGLVRAVDIDNRYIYISTPLSHQELSDVNLLMKGAINIPEQVLLNQKSENNVPYVDNTVASTGASSLIQRRHMPRKPHV